MEKIQNNISELVKTSLANAMSYQEYRKIVADHTAKGTSTGPNQSEALSQYTLLNDSRMRRLDKTVQIPDEIEAHYRNLGGDVTWLVLTESWCGDAAQSMPAMNKLSELSEGINFKVILRDENLDLMNQFLTNGTLSIPKLIVFDHEKNKVIGNWGPRPSVATAMVEEFKKENGALTAEFKKDLQIWYNKDKSKNIVEDLYKLMS